MSFSKVLFLSSLVFLGVLGIIAWFRGPTDPVSSCSSTSKVEEIIPLQKDLISQVKEEKKVLVVEKEKLDPVEKSGLVAQALPEGNCIDLLFATDSTKLPFVETITYSSRVPWLKGRPAWLADYAAHYQTTKHFIARSLNRKADYLTQKISLGDRFNVLRKDKAIQFYLVIDLSLAKMWFYCFDQEANERILLKTYPVGLGRKDSKALSGCLTPLGTFKLGGKVAMYKPGVTGIFKDKKVELIRVFGARWIPFGEAISGETGGLKGYGLHGAPWTTDVRTGELREEREKIGKYDSDGCIRLLSEDIAELYAIVISRPTFVEIVKNFAEAHLPGLEKNL